MFGLYRLAAAAVVAAAALVPAARAEVVLKASHQFPGGKGDVRDEMVQIIAREVKAANVGLEIQVFPAPRWSSRPSSGGAPGQIDIARFRSTTRAAGTRSSARR